MSVPPQVTVEELQKRLSYPDITFAVFEATMVTGLHQWAAFSVHPRPDTSEALELIFDTEVRYIQSLHFGSKPHWHFESSEKETANCNRAVRVTRALVHQRLHMVEEFDAHGEPWSWSLQVKTALPLVYDKRFTHYRRVYFNLPPGPLLPIPAECRRPVL